VEKVTHSNGGGGTRKVNRTESKWGNVTEITVLAGSINVIRIPGERDRLWVDAEKKRWGPQRLTWWSVGKKKNGQTPTRKNDHEKGKGVRQIVGNP